jgi:hypothetical protein
VTIEEVGGGETGGDVVRRRAEPSDGGRPSVESRQGGGPGGHMLALAHNR